MPRVGDTIFAQLSGTDANGLTAGRVLGRITAITTPTSNVKQFRISNASGGAFFPAGADSVTSDTVTAKILFMASGNTGEDGEAGAVGTTGTTGSSITGASLSDLSVGTGTPGQTLSFTVETIGGDLLGVTAGFIPQASTGPTGPGVPTFFRDRRDSVSGQIV